MLIFQHNFAFLYRIHEINSSGGFKLSKSVTNAAMASSFERIFAQINREVSPTASEARKEMYFARGLIVKLQKALPTAKVTLVGSTARDTGLRGDRDIDIFAAFPRHLSREHIVKKTFNATRKSVKAKWEEHYAEHPYLQAVIGPYQIEVIPCFAIAPHETIKSAVDRSPLHMDYLQKMLSDKQKRDVRVMKKLLKVNEIYGAEAETGGFSGLVCEQLMLNYQNLENLLKEAAKWRPPVYIDIEGSWEAHTKLGRKRLAEKFPEVKFVLIDAIDRNRNAAAAISAGSLAKFVLLARAFVKRPSVKFFRDKQTKIKTAQLKREIRKRQTAIAVAVVKKPSVVHDILFPQLKRTEKNLAKQLQLSGFTVLGSASAMGKKDCTLLFEVTHAELPAVRKLQGPPAWFFADAEKFLKGKKILRGPYLEGDRVCVDVEQRERKIENTLKQLLHGDSGIASHLVKPCSSARVALLPRGLKGTTAQAAVDYLTFEKLVV